MKTLIKKTILLLLFILISANIYAAPTICNIPAVSFTQHHSDSTGAGSSFEATKRYHLSRVDRQGNKWQDIGYNIYIDEEAVVHYGRPLNTIGAHKTGRNEDSISICLAGKEKHSIEQLEVFKAVVNQLRVIEGDLPIEFHHEQCPSDFTKQQIKKIK